MKKKSNLNKVFSKEIVDYNKLAIKTFDYYKKVSDLIYRTNTALGKNKFIYTSSSSTEEISIDSNVFKSTT